MTSLMVYKIVQTNICFIDAVRIQGWFGGGGGSRGGAWIHGGGVSPLQTCVICLANSKIARLFPPESSYPLVVNLLTALLAAPEFGFRCVCGSQVEAGAASSIGWRTQPRHGAISMFLQLLGQPSMNTSKVSPVVGPILLAGRGWSS